MKITVETRVNAPIAKVWTAYTTPADIQQWNTPSSDWHTTKANVDLSEGGAFSSRMEAKDGSFGFDFDGIYTKLVVHELIEYRMSDGREATVAFSNTGQDINVHVTFDAETQNSEEMQRGGWQAILDSFAKHVESH